jgi:hypothetical protein
MGDISIKGQSRIMMASGGRTPAWQRKEGKDPKGGLNRKGNSFL